MTSGSLRPTFPEHGRSRRSPLSQRFRSNRGGKRPLLAQLPKSCPVRAVQLPVAIFCPVIALKRSQFRPASVEIRDDRSWVLFPRQTYSRDLPGKARHQTTDRHALLVWRHLIFFARPGKQDFLVGKGCLLLVLKQSVHHICVLLLECTYRAVARVL